jgi:hypothetical protein
MTTSTTTAGTTMRAILQKNYGEAENVLRLGQAGRLAIGDREVLLRVHAAGVDRGVWHLAGGLPYPVRLALLHALAKIHATVDDPNLMSQAGLVPVRALRGQARKYRD